MREVIFIAVWLSVVTASTSAGGSEVEDSLSVLHQQYAHLPEAERRTRVAYDVFHFLVASQANMYAALSWNLIHLLTLPSATAVVAEMAALKQARGRPSRSQHQYVRPTHIHAGSSYSAAYEVVAEQMPSTNAFIQETLRMVQQSLTLRKVLHPITLNTELGPLSYVHCRKSI